MSKNFLIAFAIGIVCIAIGAWMVVYVNRGAYVDLPGKVLKVRTAPLDEASAVAVVDFRVSNPASYPFVVARSPWRWKTTPAPNPRRDGFRSGCQAAFSGDSTAGPEVQRHIADAGLGAAAHFLGPHGGGAVRGPAIEDRGSETPGGADRRIDGKVFDLSETK